MRAEYAGRRTKDAASRIWKRLFSPRRIFLFSCSVILCSGQVYDERLGSVRAPTARSDIAAGSAKSSSEWKRAAPRHGRRERGKKPDLKPHAGFKLPVCKKSDAALRGLL